MKSELILFYLQHILNKSQYIVANKDPIVLMLFRVFSCGLLCIDFIIIDVEPNALTADIGINDRIYIQFLLTFFPLQFHFIYLQCNVLICHPFYLHQILIVQYLTNDTYVHVDVVVLGLCYDFILPLMF